MTLRRLAVTSALVLATATAAHAAADGLVVLDSPHGVAATTDRLEAALRAKGLTVFARIDHAEGARSVGDELPPTQLLLFGNPRVGTPLMRCAPTIAIDLPQKALIWEGRDGKVHLGYNDPHALARRHGMHGCEGTLDKVEKVLGTFARAAVAP